jgi:hypothetical protein
VVSALMDGTALQCGAAGFMVGGRVHGQCGDGLIGPSVVTDIYYMVISGKSRDTRDVHCLSHAC